MPSRVLPITLGVLFVAPLAAQELRLRDGPWPKLSACAFDQLRNRLVLIGDQRDLHEWDGQRWLHRPFLANDFADGVLAWHGASGRTLAFGIDNGFAAATWDWDGASWRRLAPLTTPPARFTTAMAYDSIRGRVVMFGGTDGFTQDLGDTWEWDGANWQQRIGSWVSPPPRSSTALAFDSARGVTILFGGQSANGPVGDQWQWDGTFWQQVSPTVRPAARLNHAMAFDAVRARTVLFGGLGVLGGFSDLWEYDGAAWTLIPAAVPAPAGRWVHTLIATSAEVLLFGGGANGDAYRDAWSWNGTQWTPRTPLPAMPPGAFRGREAPAVATDPATGGALLFGGGVELPARLYGDTWRWDGAAWTQVATTGPSPRLQAAAWNAAGNVWLFGGALAVVQPFTYANDTWRWNGASWSAVATATSPSPRSVAAVAYDMARGRAVLFGGKYGNVLGDTWTFDGSNWQQQTPASSPPPRMLHAMANDPVRSRIVLFGGTGATWLDDTWEWDGSNWTQVVTANRPPATGVSSMDFDVQKGRIVLAQQGPTTTTSFWSYDGADWTALPVSIPYLLALRPSVVGSPANRGVLVLDGWHVYELTDVPARAETYGSPCGSAPTISGRTWPRPGNGDFGIDVCLAPANAPLVLVAATAPANLPVGPCTLLVAPGQASLFALANAGGFVSLNMPVPTTAALLGFALFLQVAALEPSTPAGFVLSTGLRVTVGH